MKPNPPISILDLLAIPDFQTESSASFKLERHSNSLNPCRQIGWIDVHHPCEGHIKAHIKVFLPEEYQQPDTLENIQQAVFKELAIPDDVTWEVEMVGGASGTCMLISQRVDRTGMTDAL